MKVIKASSEPDKMFEVYRNAVKDRISKLIDTLEDMPEAYYDAIVADIGSDLYEALLYANKDLSYSISRDDVR